MQTRVPKTLQQGGSGDAKSVIPEDRLKDAQRGSRSAKHPDPQSTSPRI